MKAGPKIFDLSEGLGRRVTGRGSGSRKAKRRSKTSDSGRGTQAEMKDPQPNFVVELYSL